MLNLIFLLAVSGGPYGGFQARYRPFASESLRPIRLVELRRKGCDVTSSLYPKRALLVAILARAKAPGRFGEANAGLLLRLGREEWAVDADGVVLHHSHSANLSEADFTRLRAEILDALPDVRDERAEVDRLLIEEYKKRRKARGNAGGRLKQ